MKKLISFLMALVLISVGVGCSQKNNKQESGGFYRGSYTGIVTDRFVEQETENKFDIVVVEIDDGSIIHFTVTKTSEIIGADNILINDKIEILSENYVDSDYRPILTATIDTSTLDVN